MISSEVKKFRCFGEGWATRAGIDIDFSKLDWGKGTTLNIANTGIVDPLFGDTESYMPWYDDVEFVIYILNQNPELAKNFIKATKDMVEAENIDATIENLDNVVKYTVDEDSCGVRDFFESMGICKGCAICGVTDNSYFAQLVIDSGLEIDSNYISVVEL